MKNPDQIHHRDQGQQVSVGWTDEDAGRVYGLKSLKQWKLRWSTQSSLSLRPTSNGLSSPYSRTTRGRNRRLALSRMILGRNHGSLHGAMRPVEGSNYANDWQYSNPKERGLDD